MKINRIFSIYFSPNRTTEKVTEYIKDFFEKELKIQSFSYDITYPENRVTFPKLNEDDLVVFGMPTYAGRLPNLILPYFEKVKGNNAKVITLVTFGNRNFDDSLLELNLILERNGFNILGSSAIASAHSFSRILGSSLPNEKSFDEILNFSKIVLDKIKNDKISNVNVPGHLNMEYYKPKDEYGNDLNFLKIKVQTNSTCTNCKKCVNVCPMGVIDYDNPKEITGPCIKCNACVKVCPINAKYFDDLSYLTHKRILETVEDKIKENSFYY